MKLNGLKGLKAHQEAQERKTSTATEDAPKYMKLKDGLWIKGYFVEELDDEATNYDTEIGTAQIVLEHSGPGPMGYQRRGECTVDEEDGHSGCYPHQKRWEANRDKTEDWMNWKKAQPRVYVNFYVTEAGGTNPKKIANPHEAGDVVLIAQSADSKQSIMPSLLDYASEGSITDRPYRITCSGEGTDTNYVLRSYDKEAAPFKPAEVERNDLSKAYRAIPFEEQQSYYESAPGWVPTGGSVAKESTFEAAQGEKAKTGFTGW